MILDNFQKHSYPIGIVVNMNGERFIDEGADYRNHTYAKYGREVMKQPQRAAVQIFDAKTHRHGARRIPHPQVTKATANTIEELAEAARHQRRGAEADDRRVQRRLPAGRVQPLDPRRRRAPKGSRPPKSNWALPIDKPPYSRLRRHLRHHLHLRRPEDQHRRRRCSTSVDKPIPGLYAAGELVGGLFYQNYPGGTGLLNGSVFGRLAGKNAGQAAPTAA